MVTIFMVRSMRWMKKCWRILTYSKIILIIIRGDQRRFLCRVTVKQKVCVQMLNQSITSGHFTKSNWFSFRCRMLDLHSEEVQGGNAEPTHVVRVQVRGWPRESLRAQVRTRTPLQLLWRRHVTRLVIVAGQAGLEFRVICANRDELLNNILSTLYLCFQNCTFCIWNLLCGDGDVLL